jgi:16S rRNA (cytosine1402-N4)-methyltransferase
MSNKISKLINEETNKPINYHIPVLLNEVIDALSIKPNGIYVDCTFGGGGHSKVILSKLNEEGRLIAFDQDEDAKANIPNDDRVLFIPQNFKHLQRFLKLHKINEVDGVLADLGVSSHQFDEADRGFSIRFDADLDMRMDKRQALTAAKILAEFTEQQLHKLFEKFGEVTNAKTLAKTIVEQRSIAAIKTINEFKKAIHTAVKGNPQKYFAQVFQALRIEVNSELEVLENLLQQIPPILKPQGRLEDRIVKNFFKTGSVTEIEEDDVYGTKPHNPLTIITKKPITATAEELKQNSRSRSAKLRVAEKK